MSKFRLLPLLLLLSIAFAACGGASSTTEHSGNALDEAADAIASDQDDTPHGKDQHKSQPASNQDLAVFIPEGYEILDSARGDLNRDPHPDIVLLLKAIDEESAQEDGSPLFDAGAGGALRPVVLLFGMPDGGYTYHARADRVAMCSTCGGVFGDPHDGITIKNGYFSIEHFGGSSWKWTRIITFKYDPDTGEFFLHRDGGSSFNSNTGEESPEEVKTVKDFGRVPFVDFDVNN